MNWPDYKIFRMSDGWVVYSGCMKYGFWVKEDIVFSSESIADCYAWIKAKEEDIIHLE